MMTKLGCQLHHIIILLCVAVDLAFSSSNDDIENKTVPQNVDNGENPETELLDKEYGVRYASACEG